MPFEKYEFPVKVGSPDMTLFLKPSLLFTKVVFVGKMRVIACDLVNPSKVNSKAFESC